MRGLFVTATFALLTLLALGVQIALVARTGYLQGDFRAFYCAAQTASHGANPYHTEPLRTCEVANGQRRAFRDVRVTVPAPLPGYAIAAFEPFTLLPFASAAAVWIVILLLASAACVRALARIAAIPWHVPVAAFVLALGAASIPLGEIVPIVIAAICACAYFAWRGRWHAAAIAGAVAMIEPHLGLPVCLALAIWAPATRVTLAIAAAVLASVSLFALGRAVNLEYFTSVLPAHALSEVGRDTQFSLTTVLASLGVNYTAALRAGSLWYAGMLAAGVFVAGRLSKEAKNPAFLACVPPAFAVFGGAYIHVTQIAAALPAALLLLPIVRAERRTAAVVAVMLLSVPWVMAWSPALGLAPALPIGYLAWRRWNGNLRAVLVASVLAAGLIVGLNQALSLAAARPSHTYAGSLIDPQLAEAPWAEFSSGSSTGGLGTWLVRIPTWAGLALLLRLTVGDADLLRRRTAPRRALS